MNKNSEQRKILFIGFCALLAVFFTPDAVLHNAFFGVNDLARRYSYLLSRQSLKIPKIVCIAIDDYSLSKVPERWPWKRGLYAQALQIIDQERVNTIGIDFALVGASDSQQDALLSDTLGKLSAKSVLAYFFDVDKGVPVLPLDEFQAYSYTSGLLNTPVDEDNKVRRLRTFIQVDDTTHYSFAVALAAAYLGREPGDIVSSLRLLKDKTFPINYLIKPKDITTVSFYDCLKNLPVLKKQYGQDFLRDAFVLIYPSAQILHDIHLTPLGELPGGLLHLNGVMNIVLKRALHVNSALSFLMLALAFGFVALILRYSGFVRGLLFTLGTLVISFWCLVLLSLTGNLFDYARVIAVSLLFFFSASTYKYIRFLAGLLAIKHKATMDPLRGLFTLRYFYYRLELELKKIFFKRNIFLVFVRLEGIIKACEGIPLERVKELWSRIGRIIAVRESFWSVYSPEEISGAIVTSWEKIGPFGNYLANNLGALMQEKDIKPNVKVAFVRVKKEFSCKEALFVLSKKLSESTSQVLTVKEEEMAASLGPTSLVVREGDAFLESLDEDIEEKNRQLLLLIERLSKENEKTREAAFAIVNSLVKALEARDPYTEGHSERVALYSLKLAEKVGWGNLEREKLKQASLLHDLGKIGIPDSILHKKGKLTDDEYDIIKKHEVLSVKILEPLADIKEILPWIMYHHERWDGKGYPHGLGGNAIPQASQFIALADVYDALTTGRDYKAAFSRDDALAEIARNKGTQFSPELTDIFIELIRQM